ncbi:MAG: DUF4834 family protein [Tannerellaceae bacterium]|jgi:hypothetical protein|nr:DUF4834 family protein [Tannerellaceae bacterium]
MFKFLLFIFFFIILLGFLAGFSILRSLRDALFGPPSGSRKSQQQTTAGKKTSHNRSAASRKKIIRKDEGEYIDYEEVK